MNKQTYSLLINLRDSNVLLRNIGIENKTSVKLHHYYYFKLINYKNFCFFFFLNDPPPPEIYPLPLHAALPISQADCGGGDRLAEPRPYPRVGGRLGFQRGAVPAPLPAPRRTGAARLLRDGGLRSALEGLPGRRGRLLLGGVRRQPPAEVRLQRADRARARVAHSRRGVGGGGAAGAGTAVSQQRGAAQPRSQFPRGRGVRRRHHCGVGDLRLHAAVHDRRERHCRSEEHTSELQSQSNLVCRLLLEKK